MADTVIHKVEAPDGTILKIEGPADATPEQINAFAQQIYSAKSKGADDKTVQRVAILQDEYRKTYERMLMAEQIAIDTPTKENKAAYERAVGDIESLRREITKVGGEDAIPDMMPPAEQAAPVETQASEQDFQAQKARMAVDVLGAGLGAGASKVLDLSSRGGKGLDAIIQFAEAAKNAPQASSGASSGAKWLQNWGNIPREGFQGGVPEAAAQYNKMKPQGQIMKGLSQRGLVTPQPVQPGVFTGGQLSISGQTPAAPAPGPLSQAGGMAKKAVGAVTSSPVLSGALGGLSLADSGQEFYERYRQKDIPGMMISGAGMVGGGLQMVPHLASRTFGAGLSAASPLTMYLYDKLRSAPAPAPATPEELQRASKPAFVFPSP